MAARGLAQRSLGRVDKVVYWAVDFVPDRFGRGLMTKVYDRLDAMVTRRADLQIDLSAAALEGRRQRHGLQTGGAPSHVAPIGAWLDRLPTTPEDGWRARRVIFLGHLVPRQGVARMVDALELLAERGVEFEVEIAGRGPEEESLKAQVARAGLDSRVRFRRLPLRPSGRRVLCRFLVGRRGAEPRSSPSPATRTRQSFARTPRPGCPSC